MPLAVNTRLESYTVLEPIGAGGMGEVYRARDSKLDRDVAIKVLPEIFAGAPERLARFEREAKLLASLNHPNIAAIYGVEQEESIHFLVLELVPGETLAERLHRGPIPVEETLRLAKQVAEALEAAHAKGVIHRDLKPGNVKVTPDGQVKVLDFGLAKAFDDETAGSDASQSPTLSAGSTRAGLILGTAAYMSPEQARGLPVDKRTDIFSFGSLVYEMLTGRKAFDGELVSDALASVIKSDPDWNGLPPSLSPRLRELLKRCLEKNPNQRRRDIGDVRIEIEQILSGADEPAEQLAAEAQHKPFWRRAAPVALALAAGILFGIGVTRRPEPSKPVLRFSTPLPEGSDFTWTGRHAVALSPDGTRLAYSADNQIYLREMAELEPRPIRGTEGDSMMSAARNPVFSPDSDWLLFWGDGKLQKVAVSGGAALTLCEAGNPWGASWTEDDRIIFAEGSEGIWSVSANGGEPEVLVPLEEGEGLAHGPQVLPGGQAIVFTLASTGFADAEVVVQPLPEGERRVLMKGRDARYLPTGHLVYALEDSLFAIRFDPDTLQTSGGAVPLLEGVEMSDSTGAAHFSISSNGTLLYMPSGSGETTKLVWVDREGETPLTVRGSAHFHPRLSPDGRRLAVEIREGGSRDIWIHDIERNTDTRLTADGESRYPVWSPDGQWVAFSNLSSAPGLYRRRSDFSGGAERLLETSERVVLDHWSRDGRWLIFSRLANETQPSDAAFGATERDIWALSLEGNEEPRVIVRSPFTESTGTLSPDGRFLLYHSSESGEFQVYATSFSGSGRRVQISTEGGVDAHWSAAGDRVIYVNPSSEMFYEVDITTDPELRAGKPRDLFKVDSYPDDLGFTYDPDPVGDRIVTVEPASGSGQPSLVVVVNWIEELKARVPTQ